MWGLFKGGCNCTVSFVLLMVFVAGVEAIFSGKIVLGVILCAASAGVAYFAK